MGNDENTPFAVSFLACVAMFVLKGGNATLFDVRNYGALFNVTNYGAIGDGQHDDTRAFIDAWRAVCEFDGVTPTLNIPEGRNFLLSPVTFQGPCKASRVQVQVLGDIVAPEDPKEWKGCVNESWILFSTINNLQVYGSGKINGSGQSWWKDYGKLNYSNENGDDCDKPTALRFFECDGLELTGLTHANSPKNHISITSCNHVNISHLQIIAPIDSPNTDGIDISMSTNVSISLSNIQTGDDCVAINTGCFNIRISQVSCGPGHGISVGSLGKDGSFASVETVIVEHCNFTGTQNGIRIKTWPGGSGYARDIHFSNITLKDVEHPIIIDQFYCNGEFHCKREKPSAVNISDVTFADIRGSSAKEQAIQLICSKNKPCTNVTMYQVNITSADPEEKTYASCNNIIGTSSLTTPKVPCLSRPRLHRM